MNGERRHFNQFAFDNINTPAKSYWLGIIYTDGNVSTNGGYVSLELKDKEHIEKFKQFLESDHEIKLTNTDTWVLSVGSQYLNKKLCEYGVICNKSHNSGKVYIPTGDLEKYFWRGCFDGDGCLAYYPGKPKHFMVSLILTNSNRWLLEQCKRFFKGKGYIVTKRDSINPYYQWWIGPGSRQRIYPYLETLYREATIDLRLERKYNVYEDVARHVI